MVHFFSANFWMNFSRFFSIGIGMSLTVAFANLLSPEIFGTYKYVLAAASLVAAFSLNGFSSALMRAVAQGKKNVVPAVVRSATIWNIPASIVTFGVSIYYFSQGNSDLGFAFLFIAVSNATINGLGSTKGVWASVGNFKTPALAGLPRALVSSGVILLTIILTQDVVWILFAYFGLNILLSWIGYLWMLRKLKIQGSNDGVPETLRYGKQMSLLAFFQLAGAQLDQLLMWHFTDPATLALYALAIGPLNEAKNFINNFFAVSFHKIASKTHEELHRAIPFRLRQLFLMCVVLSVAYVALVPLLFTVLFPAYEESILVSQVLAITILFLPRGLIDVFFVTHGEIKKRSAVILGCQIFRFVLLCTLIPLWGLWGAVGAAIISELVAFLVYIIAFSLTKKSSAATFNSPQV